MTKISLQEYADGFLSPEWKQPLMTIEEALAKIGWEYVDRPVCCGQPVETSSFIGSCYQACCNVCGKFIFDVTGPSFGNSWVNVVDSDKVDMDSSAFGRRWVANIKPDLAIRTEDK